MSRPPYPHSSGRSDHLPPIFTQQPSSSLPPPPPRSHHSSEQRISHPPPSASQSYSQLDNQRAYHPSASGPSQTGRYHAQHDQPSTSRSHPPASNPSALTSHVFAFRPPANANGTRQYSTPSIPSSFARSSISPTRDAYVPYSQPETRPPRSKPSRPGPVVLSKAQEAEEEAEEDDEASSVEDEDATEKQKLETKREKNRLKQRNLRLRRANHVAELETALETLGSKHKLLSHQHEDVLRREAGLDGYVASLEGLLQRHGLEAEMAKLKSDWRPTEELRGQQREREEENAAEEDIGRGAKRRKVSSTHNKAAIPESRHRGSLDIERTSDGFVLPHRVSDPGPSSSRPDHSSGPTAIDQTIRPRRSTSSFSPLVLDASQTSPYLSAPSPRSIRIEDLLSPSFIQEDTAVPLSAFTIDTPTPLAPTPYNPSDVDPRIIPRQMRGGVEMRSEGSKDSMDTRSGAGSAVDGGLDIESPGYTRLNPTAPGSRSTPQTPGTVGPKPIHPSVYTARILLRALLVDQTNIPISHCVLPPLTPSQQMILLNALYNLTAPAFRDEVNYAQARNLPNMLMKRILDYANLPSADLRVVLMPIAILRARVIGFLEEKLPFDITAFISHVLADGRIFGDTADPDAWEMSGLFWDVWGGWFKAGRGYCTSMSSWRRRDGHTGANVIEVLLGLEGNHSRMEGLIGKPEGWQKIKVVAPDKTMTENVRIPSP